MKKKPGGQRAALKPFCLVSACLCGFSCRYDGKARAIERLAALCRAGLALPVCPEMEGGLNVPREPCELHEGRAVTKSGLDVTDRFRAGAVYVLELARSHDIRLAILKERSPSCGSSQVYDGSFSGRLVPGQGVAAGLLREHGIRVINELSLMREMAAVAECAAEALRGAITGEAGN